MAVMEYSQPLAQDKDGNARKVAATLYGEAVEFHPYNSMACDVFRLEFPDGRGAKILKVPRGAPAELLREQKIMRSLRAHGFPKVPRLEHTQETDPVEGITYTAMPFFRGGGIWGLSSMELVKAKATYERMGRFAGRLSLLRVDNIEGAWTEEERQREGPHPVMSLAEERLARHPQRNARFAELLRSHRELTGDLSGFCHGDGPHSSGLGRRFSRLGAGPLGTGD